VHKLKLVIPLAVALPLVYTFVSTVCQHACYEWEKVHRLQMLYNSAAHLLYTSSTRVMHCIQQPCIALFIEQRLHLCLYIVHRKPRAQDFAHQLYSCNNPLCFVCFDGFLVVLHSTHQMCVQTDVYMCWHCATCVIATHTYLRC